MYNRVFLCQKSHFRVSTSFGEFFFDRGSCWHKRWWNSLWHFSEKSAPVHASPINAFHLAALHRTRSGRMSLKNCVFGCEGKITSVMRTVDAVCFSGAATEFLKCVCWRTFINKTQFDAGFAHRLILKDGAVPAIKDPGHNAELQTVS